MRPHSEEPVISVGLLDQARAATIQLEGEFADCSGQTVGPGEIRVTARHGLLQLEGAASSDATRLEIGPQDPRRGQFLVETTIGIDFHWQQQETQAFQGALAILAQGDDRLTVINRVPLETYLTSVICSEMNAASPEELAKAHAVISRSWLLAQLNTAPRQPGGDRRPADAAPSEPVEKSPTAPEYIRWTDRETHTDFDVCADDHCQRYQGTGRVNSPRVAAAIAATRGQVLTWEGRACDARYSKCCGGVTEEFPTAWADVEIPYLTAVADCRKEYAALPPLQDEMSAREFIEHPPSAYCNCRDPSILGRVLNDYDRTTHDFFRWKIRLDATEASNLAGQKLTTKLGRLLALQPLARGPSGRIKRLRIVGESGEIIVGKELEIRRVLSRSHLYSSAFVVDTEGPSDRPHAFHLTGAGWGHGVGLCQIGAAVMACQGIAYRDILGHYYPGAALEVCYS
jgi:peptidoglycan hydrolase-like amidase